MVNIDLHNGSLSVIIRIIAPIIRRMPYRIIRSPEITVNNRYGHIDWRNNIVWSVNIRVTYKLHNHCIVLCLLKHNGRYILIDIGSKYSLQDHQTGISFRLFKHPYIIHIPISVQIKIRQLSIVIIDFPLKFLQGLTFGKDIGYGTKIKIGTNFTTIGCNGDV